MTHLKRRIASVLLAACLLIGLLPTSALAVETRTDTGAFQITDNEGSTENSYTYSNGVLTVNDGANITISMVSGATEPASDRIVVAANATATITLAGVNIEGSDRDDAQNIAAKSAIDLSNGSILTIDLSANAENTLTGGSGNTDGSGAPGIHVPDSASLIIQGEGNLSVSGGTSNIAWGGVGIGGNAGSGGDAGEACGTVICFASGSVNITAGASAEGNLPADDIGGGKGPQNQNGDDGQGIRPGTDGTCTVYGDLILPCDITIPQGGTVVIPEGASLTVPKDVTLTNNGTIQKDGGSFINDGTVTGQQPADDRYTINYAEETITIGEGYEVYAAETGGDKIENNSSITDYIGESLYLQQTGSETTGRTAISIPARPEEPGITDINFSYSTEKLTIAPNAGFSADDLEYTKQLSQSDQEWAAVPESLLLSEMGWAGSQMNLYFRIKATETSFASAATTTGKEIPSRPAAPIVAGTVTGSTENSITIGAQSGQEYRCGIGDSWGEWKTISSDSNSIKFEDLEPGTEYTIQNRYQSGEDENYQEHFASFAHSTTATTWPCIKTTSLKTGYVGVPYSAQLEAVVAEGTTVSWSLMQGSSLPAGLTLSSDGTISGTPTAATPQMATFTVTATIGEGASSVFTTQDLTISVTKSDAELGNLTVSGNTGYNGKFQYGDIITVTFTPERKADTSTNALAENTATLTYTNAEGDAVTLATATAQADGSFTLTYDTREKKLPCEDNMTLTVSYGGSGELNPAEKATTVSLESATLKNLPTITGIFEFGQILTAHYEKQDDETVTYQWLRDGANLTGATGITYTLTEEDIGKNIEVKVIASDYWHYGSRASNHQMVVSKAPGSIEIACDSVTYGETVQPSVTSTTNEDANVAYSYAGTDGTSYGPSSEAPQNAGTYTVTATVAETATHTAATSDPVTFTISKASQTAPAAPTAARTTTSSITLNTISANANGAAAEYGISKDGGATWTWQSGPEFTGLSSNTTYQFAARYAETDNYAASDSSSVVSIATDRRSSGGGSSSSSRDEGPSTGDSDGWRDIQDEIADAEDGDTITIDMNGETEVPGEIFEEVAGKDVDVEIDLGGGVSWTVNGQDVPEGVSLSDLDLGVSMDTKGIPVNVFNAVTGEYGSVQFTLAHDGAFGFTMTLTAPLGRENAGYWANLYYYNERGRELEFITSARIGRDGSAALWLEHASQYAVVIDDESHEPAELPFRDVPEDYWAYDAIRYVYGEGLMAGTSADAFSPDATTTRGQIVTILWRLSDSPVVNYMMDFSDVSLDSYYAEAIRWATSKGIVGGYGGGVFGPNDPITREQLAVMLYRYAQHEGYDTTQGGMAIREYADYEQISDFALEAMNWAVSAGIINGTSATTLSPSGSATRAQVAVILMRFCQEFVEEAN